MALSRLRAGACCALLFVTASVGAASAQSVDPDYEPIGRFMVDARGLFTNYPAHETLATFHGVVRDNLPRRGLGVVIGAHVYLLRIRVATLGVGGEYLMSRGSRTFVPAEVEGQAAGPEGPTVNVRLSGYSPQASLNFGHRQGWSYLTGGFGWTKYASERPDLRPIEPRQVSRMFNYGGGARWFLNDHLAFTMDLRFYSIAAQEGTAARLDLRFIEEGTTTRPSVPRMRLIFMSAGVSFK